MTRLLACLVLLLGSTGCHLLYKEKFVDPEYDLRDSNLVVVPFRDLDHWYYEVSEGRELAKFVMVELQRECDLEVVGGAEVENAVWDNVEDVDWTEVGKSVEADFVLFGTIHELRNDTRGVVGFLRGTVRVDLSVWDVEKGKLAFQRRVQTIYPEDVESGDIGVTFEQSRAELRKQLFARAAKKVSATFCGEWVDRY